MSSKIVQIENKLKGTSNPEEMIDLLNELSAAVRTVDANRSLKLSDEAIKLAEKHGNKKGLALSLWNRGVANRLISEYQSSLKDFNDSLEILKEINETKEQGKVLNSAANVYANIGDYENALKYLNDSLKISQSINDLDNIASVLSNMGVVYQETGDYPSSLEKYLESMQAYNGLDREFPEVLLNNVGVVYHKLGDYPEALGYHFRSLTAAQEKENKYDEGFALLNIAMVYSEITEHDKALNYLTKSLEILRELGNKPGESDVLRNIGIAYQGLEDYEKALEFQFKVLKVREEISDLTGKADTLIHIGNIYFQTGKLANAEKYYKDALALSKQVDNKVIETLSLMHLGKILFKNKSYSRGFEFLTAALKLAEKRNAKKEMYEIHRALYEGYKLAGDITRALKHHEISYEIEKEITDFEADKKLKSLTIQHQIQTADKERRIAVQEKEIFRLKNVELAEINEKLNRLNEEKNIFLGIAAHDLKNPLSGIMSLTGKIQKRGEESNQNELIGYTGEIEKAVKKMMWLVTEMLDITAIESGKRNLNFEEFNPAIVLQRVVFDYREKAETKKIEIEYTAEDNLIINTDKSALRQIIDNLVSNAVKFSPESKKIYVSVSHRDGFIKFGIKDEGPGLTEKDKTKLFGKFTKLSAQPTGGEDSTGLGLSIVKNLTEMLGGSVRCEGKEGEGAAFIVELPIDRSSPGSKK
jgi:signal transduction histidine kinase/Tfp pilus assembly protein PilF